VSAPYRFGFSEFTTWPWPLRRDVERYPAHGATEIEICEFKLAHEDVGLLKDLGPLRPASVQMNVHSVFVDSMANKPQDPQDRIAAMKRALAASAPHLPSGTPFVVITGAAPDGNVRRAVERTVEALRELGDAAAQCGMRIAFEPLNPVNLHTDTAIWRLEDGLELVERVAHPSVGLCLDTWNVWQSCDLERTIARCAGKIFLVQLSDWQPPRSDADRYSLGDGEIPLAEIVRAVRRTGYEGAWIVEILSSMHLDGSLWKADLDDLLERNRAAFEEIWSRSAP
jgi:sugar phosphate isomerase/epimerase